MAYTLVGLLGFYLGGAFYVGSLVSTETGQQELWSTIVLSALGWPFGLYQILTGQA